MAEMLTILAIFAAAVTAAISWLNGRVGKCETAVAHACTVAEVNQSRFDDILRRLQAIEDKLDRLYEPRA